MKKTLFVALAVILSGAFSTAYAAKKDKKAAEEAPAVEEKTSEETESTEKTDAE